MFRRFDRLMDDGAAAASAGGAAAPAATPAAAAPAPAASAPAAPAPAPAADGESLLKKPGAAAPAPAAAGDFPTWLPEKYRVTGADGKFDLAASGQKMNEGLSAAVKRIGTVEAPPENAEGYQFNAGDKYKDVTFDDAMSKSFREFCHAKGITQDQYQGIMEQYLELVPGVLDAALKLQASEARAELQKVWKTTAEFDAGLSAAQRAVDAAPEAIRESLWARLGRDPEFIQFAASLGKEMREDRSSNGGTTAGTTDIETLMGSQAYRDPKHADHQKVSLQVQQMLAKRYGDSPIAG